MTSCEFLNFKSSPENEAIARVHDKYLYQSDIKDLFPENVSEEDSIAIVKNYIYLWAKQRLLLYNSELNLNINKDEFEQLVNEYRDDLYINAYREAVVNQYTDTIITSKEIQNYYETNKESFHLNEELVKLKYIVIGKEIQNPKEFTQLFSSGKQKDIEKIMENEYKLKSYNFNDSTWIRYADLQQKLPILKKTESASILTTTTVIQKQDSAGIYLLKISNILTINDIAPLNYVSSNIKQMILHKRKQELLKKIEETLVQDAIKNNQFEEYK
ncbi:MAG: hypothetical protein Q8J84_09305 [Flavobacteriaceae bacterium]|nr:hypothetical protein [Flavobacteriaceae bacterium]